MEDSLEENFTTRSLLKGILATEAIHPPVHHRTRKSVSHTPVSIIYQDKISTSPSISLQSQMRERVKRRLGKSALENSSVKRTVHAKRRRKSEAKVFHNAVEELDKVTPRTLLKKIIQNEDEVSIIVSQGSKNALEAHTKQEGTYHTRLSSITNVDLSLPDIQDTEHLSVFRNTRKKRRVDISQFERELDGKMQINKDILQLDRNFEDSTLANVNMTSRSFQHHLNISAEPQSIYKKVLLRKPNKALLVSLGDFEQGVQDKYNLVKGSQECFIESVVEEKLYTSASKVAEQNTELYEQPIFTNAQSEKSSKSATKPFSLSPEKTNKDSRLLEIDSEGNIKAVKPNAVSHRLETSKIVEDSHFYETAKSMHNSELNEKSLKTDTNKYKSQVTDLSHIGSSQNILKYLHVEDDDNSKQKQLTPKSVLKENHTSLKSFIVKGNDGSLNTTQSPENYFLLKKDARQSEATENIWKSALLDKDAGRLKSVDRRGDVTSKVESDMEDSPPHSRVAEDTNEINRTDLMIEKSMPNEHGKQHSKTSVQVLSSSLQGDSLASASCSEILSHEKNVNKRPMLTTLIDTPNYIRNNRLRVPPNKPDVGKKFQKGKTLKKKKREGVALTGSLVKKIFGLHSKMRVSKEVFTDVETCLEEYLDQLAGDLDAYASHANRKTITVADLELLMKRQRLVTDTTPLNVLIEQHLPLECRKLLIPCAMSGNKVFPCLIKM